MASVKKNFLLSSAYQLLTVLTPIVTTPFLARVIGAGGNGEFAFTQSVANYFVLFTVLGMSSYGVRTVAECGDDRARRSEAFWGAFAMNCVTGVVVLAFYAAFVLVSPGEYRLLYLVWGLWVAGSALDVSWLFFGVQEFAVPTARNFATKIASVACILLFVRGPQDVWIYAFSVAGASFANSVLIWPFVRCHVDLVRPTWKSMTRHLRPNLTLFVPVVAISFYAVLDKVMLGTLSTMDQAGYYDYAEKVSKMPMALITALGSAVLPRMTEIMAAGRMGEGKALVGTTIWFMEVCALALCFGIVGVAPSFCPLFFGEGFDKCVPVVSFLAFVIPAICATNVIGNQYLLPCHRDRDYTVSVSVGASVNVVVNILLIPRLGAMGAAVGTVACEFVVLAVQVWMVRGDLDVGLYARRCLPYAAAGAAMAVGLRLVDGLLRPTLSDGTSLLVEFLAGASLYLSFALLWSVRHEREALARLFPRLMKGRSA